MAGLFIQPGIHGRDLDIADGIQMRQQMIALEDETEMVSAQGRQLIGGQLPGRAPLDRVITARRSIQTAENVHQRRFAGS